MAKIWDQDLHVRFDTTVESDKIAEQVIQDIQSGIVAFNNDIVTIDKLTYRDKVKADKERRKKNKKRKKEYEKDKKKRYKEKMKAERKQKK